MSINHSILQCFITYNTVYILIHPLHSLLNFAFVYFVTSLHLSLCVVMYVSLVECPLLRLWPECKQTCEVELLGRWLHREHLGVVVLSVAQQHRGQGLDAAVGSLDDQQVQQQAFAVFVDLWVLVVEPWEDQTHTHR